MLASGLDGWKVDPRGGSTSVTIDGIPTGFNGNGTYNAVTGAGLAQYFPIAKLGGGNYFYVWDGGFGEPYGVSDNVNYYGLSAIASADYGIHSLPGITVQQAYSIDTKIDDGLPQSGNVTAIYVDSWVFWAAGGSTDITNPNVGASSGPPNHGPTTTATPATAITCYDNGGVVGVQHYSTEISNGTGINCALSFQFQ